MSNKIDWNKTVNEYLKFNYDSIKYKRKNYIMKNL